MEKFNDIINGEGVVLIDFFAQWCGPCKAMSPILSNLKQAMGDRLRILKLDIDKNSSLADKYSIKAVPTLLLFKKGKIVWRTSGVQSISELKANIERHI